MMRETPVDGWTATTSTARHDTQPGEWDNHHAGISYTYVFLAPVTILFVQRSCVQLTCDVVTNYKKNIYKMMYSPEHGAWRL